MIKHRANHSVIHWAIPAIGACLVIASVATWLRHHGSPLHYFDAGLPAGQGYYVFSKLAALCAVLLLGLQVIVGLLRKTNQLPQASDTARKWHRALGTLVVSMALVHVLFIVLAVSYRNGALSLQTLVPNPLNGFYQLGQFLGVVGLVMLVAIAASGLLLEKSRLRAHVLHRLALPAFLILLLHGWTIGSESRLSPVVVIGAMLLVLSLGLLLRSVCGRTAHFIQRRRAR